VTGRILQNALPALTAIAPASSTDGSLNRRLYGETADLNGSSI